MICNKCGKENPGVAAFCEQCGQPLPVYNTQPMSYQPVGPVLKKGPGMGQIITNLVLSVFFSFPSLILSIVALFFKAKYDSAVKYNDVSSANAYASKIKTLMTIAWIVLAVFIFISVLCWVFIVVFFMGMFSELINGAIFAGTSGLAMF